jgi:hypothetical protein
MVSLAAEVKEHDSIGGQREWLVEPGLRGKKFPTTIDHQ